MYIRCKKYKNSSRRVLAIYHSFREGSRISQKMIKYIGSTGTEEQYAALLKVAESELKILKNPPRRYSSETALECTGVGLDEVIEIERVTEGFHEVFGGLCDRLGISEILSKYRYNQLKDIIIARIAEPTSKAHTAKILEKNFQRPITVDKIYRMMDAILDFEAEIKTKIFEHSKNLCPKQNIDLLFFDVTTLHFESQKADDLRNFGFSKARKIGEVQVVLALATTSTGLPIGYTLFPGNTGEVDTLLVCLEEWKQIFNIANVTVIADRAMMSEDNLKKMEAAQLNYIVAAKLKSLPAKLKRTILERKQETSVEIQKDEIMQIQEYEYKGRRLLVSFSESRAKKDQGDRERLLKKLKSKLGKSNQANPKKLITNSGYLKFVNDKQEGSIILNEDKIAEETLWDGLHGVITSKKDAPAQEILSQYRRLWIIEESFRINKTTLEMRPIYHFKPDRIRAHILICYLAFALSRYAQFQINAFTGNGISIERIREELSSVQASILEEKSTGKYYKLPSNMSKEAKKIYQSFGIHRKHYPEKLKNFRKCSA
jgi:transposase